MFHYALLIQVDPLEMESRFNDLEPLQDAKLLRSLYATFDTSSKIFIFQATVTRLLMPIFDTPFFGLPKNLQGLGKAAEVMQCMLTWFVARLVLISP